MSKVDWSVHKDALIEPVNLQQKPNLTRDRPRGDRCQSGAGQEKFGGTKSAGTKLNT